MGLSGPELDYVWEGGGDLVSQNMSCVVVAPEIACSLMSYHLLK